MSIIKIGLVVPTLKNFRGLAECLASVVTTYDWQLFLEPNWINHNCVAKSWNNGIQHAIDSHCTHILVINDDILFSPQCIDQLVQGLYKYSDIDMLTAWSTAGPESILNYSYQEEQLLEGADFACFMIRADFLSKYGSFDENFKPAYHEDNDCHYRMKLLGGVAKKTTLAPFYHFGSKTQNMDNPVCTPEMFRSGQAYYIEKWGGLPGQEKFKTPYNEGGSVLLWK